MLPGNGLSRRGALLGLAAATLTGCASRTNRPNPVFSPIAFPGQPIPLATDRIEVKVRPRVRPEVSPADADFVVPPEQIARLWPRQRLRAVGGQYAIQYIIDDASAISRPTEDGEVVVATIQVRIVVTTPYGIEEAGTGGRVDSEIRFRGATNIIQRQEALHRLSLDIAAKLDQQLTEAVQRQLGRYIAGAQNPVPRTPVL